MALKDYEIARDYFSEVLKVDETNKAAQKNIYICKDYIKKQLEKEKQLYQAIFKKMAEETKVNCRFVVVIIKLLQCDVFNYKIFNQT